MTNAQKTPLSRTLPRFTENKILEEIALRGQSLPGHVTAVNGAIVTVAFDVLGATLPPATMPVSMNAYVRFPIQVNDKGFARAADVYIGGISGLGTGLGDLTPPANLSALIWEPVSNASWASVGQVLTLFDATLTNTIQIGPSGITLTVGSKVVTLTSSGLTIDGILFDSHHHTGVTTGSGNTGGPA